MTSLRQNSRKSRRRGNRFVWQDDNDNGFYLQRIDKAKKRLFTVYLFWRKKARYVVEVIDLYF